jgi:uncharacterized protein (TIGR03663 family)
MAELSAEQRPDLVSRRGLSATINLAQVTWMSIAWVAVLTIGAGLRLFQIGAASLSPTEGQKAFDAWSLVYGATEGPYREPSHVAPAGLLMRAFSFFLFGDSDTTVRLISALIGVALIAMIWSIRDLLGDLRALGGATLVALSPTVVFASRTVNDEIVSLFFGFLLFITVFRLGDADRTPGIGRAICLGGALAALIGSGPAGITVLLTLGIMFAVSPVISIDHGAVVQRAVRRLLDSRQLLLGALISLVIALVTLFTRFFSDPGAISGLGEVFADWGRLIATESGTTPTQFFILSMLLYEIVAIVFAISAAVTEPRTEDGATGIDWSYPAVWFLASLVIFSFSSGRQPEHAVLVAFPLLLLGGFGLGDTVETMLATGDLRRRFGLLMLAVIGLIIALISTLVLIGRVDTAINRNDALTQVLAAAIVALGPMVVLTYTMGDQLGRLTGWTPVRAAAIAGLAIVLSLLMIRTTVELSFYRIDTGVELLAQEMAAADLRDIAARIANLSRDVNGTERSPSNPPGGKEMSIALDRTVQWPFRWYFRDFPNMVITAPGDATTKEAQLVIAPDPTGMTEAGYQPRTVNAVTTVPAEYLNPSLATVFKYTFVPANWDQGLRFMLYRDLIDTTAPRTVIFGYSGQVVSKMTGERPTYKLSDRAGAGSNPGQFNQPRGVAVSPDDARVYVLDTQNGRIEVFSTDTGELLGIWGDGEGDQVTLSLTDNGLGPYGIATGPEGNVYLADTWNHRIVVVNPDGQVVRTFGDFANNEDSTDPQQNPGKFYGPRGLVVYENELYVTDTGNERVEVFGLDGAFHRAWGGTGSAPNQFIEPVGIAVSPAGQVFVADSGNARISIFDTQGKPVAQWAVPQWQGQQFYEPYLAFDPNGLLYASSAPTSSVIVFGSDGEQQDVLTDAEGVALQMPAGMAVSSTNELYIADRGSSEVYSADLGPVTGAGEVTSLPVASPEGSPQASPIASPQASPEASPSANG